jgi:citrate synthase
LEGAGPDEPFSNVIYRAVTGDGDPDLRCARMIEAMVVASVDHSVTPPSAQAAIIAAIVADMGLPPELAKALFVYGRVAGLSAHCLEEIASQPQMRRINFTEATYRDKPPRRFPG